MCFLHFKDHQPPLVCCYACLSAHLNFVHLTKRNYHRTTADSTISGWRTILCDVDTVVYMALIGVVYTPLQEFLNTLV